MSNVLLFTVLNNYLTYTASCIDDGYVARACPGMHLQRVNDVEHITVYYSTEAGCVASNNTWAQLSQSTRPRDRASSNYIHHLAQENDG